MKKLVPAFAAALALVAAMFLAFRIPAVEDRLFDAELRRIFAPKAAALLDEGGFGVFFCGTGSPLPSTARAQNCTLIFAGGRYFLVDAGTGSWETAQLAGFPGERLGGIFLTHFHSDHIGDIGEAALGSWVAGRDAPLAIYGPEGVDRIVRGLNEAYALDSAYRTAHHGKGVAPPRSAGLAARAFDGSGPLKVFDADGLVVTAFPVAHDPVRPAVGYRFDYRGRSIVLSGDTAYAESLVAAAKGADMLIHEAQANHMVGKIGASSAKAGDARLAKIMADIPAYHSTPVDAARAANEAGAQLLLLTHLTPAPDNGVAKRIFLRGVSKERRRGVRLAEDGMAVILPEEGGAHFRRY